MKILITANENTPDAKVDPRFGRAPWFVIADLESGDFKYVENTQNLNAMQGAGVQSGQAVAALGVTAVITGHVGPKAFQVLQAAGVNIFQASGCTVHEAITRYRAGSLVSLNSADKPGHW